jgi:hypothetical protein
MNYNIFDPLTSGFMRNSSQSSIDQQMRQLQMQMSQLELQKSQSAQREQEQQKLELLKQENSLRGEIQQRENEIQDLSSRMTTITKTIESTKQAITNTETSIRVLQETLTDSKKELQTYLHTATSLQQVMASKEQQQQIDRSSLDRVMTTLQSISIEPPTVVPSFASQHFTPPLIPATTPKITSTDLEAIHQARVKEEGEKWAQKLAPVYKPKNHTRPVFDSERNALMQLNEYLQNGAHPGRLYFNITQESGPSNDPSFTGQLEIEFLKTPALRVGVKGCCKGSKQTLKSLLAIALLELISLHDPYNTGAMAGIHHVGHREFNTSNFKMQSAEFKQERAQYRKKQKDEKNKRVERDYRSKHRKLGKSNYTGNYREDLDQFYAYLDDKGFASSYVHQIPAYYLRIAIDVWQRSYGLIEAEELFHAARKKKKLTVPEQTLPGYKSRVLLTKAFVIDQTRPDYSHLKAVLLSKTKLSNNIGVTLKDVERYQRMKNKRMDTRDFKMQGNAMKASRMVRYDRIDSDGEEIVNNLPDDEGFVGGTIRSIGRKIGDGLKDSIMPVLDGVKTSVMNAFSNFPKIKTLLVGMTAVSIIVLAGIIGYATIVTCRKILFGLDTLFPETPEESDTVDTSKFKQQVKETPADDFALVCTKAISNSWVSTLGKGFEATSKAFSDSEVIKFTKKLGDFSSAVRNIGLLVEKLKEVMIWVINGTSRFVTGKALFAQARHIDALRDKINQLMTTVRVTEIQSLSHSEKEHFYNSYMDLVEMVPYLNSMDKVLGGQVNSALALAQPLYISCKFNTRQNVERFEPEWFYLFGRAGQGKTHVSDHILQMLFDATKSISYKRHNDFWFNGDPTKIQDKYLDTMVYNRMPEQEFWDNYLNQPVCKIDDMLQSPDQTLRAAEAFSAIRIANSAPYPLHMASILQKDNTVFRSKILFTTTNIGEHQLTEGELQLTEASAFKRRRSYAIEVTREDVTIPQGVRSKEWANTVTIKVYRCHHKTGKLIDYVEYKGVEGMTEFAHRAARDMLARHDGFKQREPMDYSKETGLYAKASELLDKKKDTVIQIDGTTASETSAVSTQASDSDNESSDDDGAGVFPPIEEFKQQMFMARSAYVYGTKMYDKLFALHPQAKHALQIISDKKNVVSYAQAKTLVAQLRENVKKDPKLWYNNIIQNENWNHNYLVHGVEIYKCDKNHGHTRATSLTFGESLSLQFGLYKTYRSNHEIWIGEKERMDMEFMTPYIGLTNPCYWLPPQELERRMNIYKSKLGFKPLLFDNVKGGYPQWVNTSHGNDEEPQLPRYMLVEFLHDLEHEVSLRQSRSTSKLQTFINVAASVLAISGVLVLLGMAAINLYNALDPTRVTITGYMSTEAFEQQSGSPQLKQQQRALARARKAPKQLMTKVQQQFADQTAMDLIPKLTKNTYLLRSTKGSVEYGNYAVGIETDIFVVPAHLMATKPEMLYLSSIEGTTEKAFIAEKCLWAPVNPDKNGVSLSDLALIRLPGMNEVPTITHLLMKQEDNVHGAVGLKRVERHFENGKIIERIIESRKPVAIISSSNYGALDKRPQKVEEMALVDLDETTLEGICGRPYLFFNTHIPRKLGFFHTAGTSTYALAGRLNQEDVQSFKKNILAPTIGEFKMECQSYTLDTQPIILDEHNQVMVPDMTKIGRDYGIEQIGEISHQFVYPTKTTLIATELTRDTEIKMQVDGKTTLQTKKPPYPVEQAPAVLRETKGIDPMRVGMDNFRKKKIIYGSYLKESDYSGIFKEEILGDSSGRILPLWEAIIGIRNHPRSHSIKRSTSVAFYLQKFAKLKRFYVCFDEAELKLHPEKERFVHVGHGVYLHMIIHTLVCFWFKVASDKKIPVNYVLACLKDELRELIKVEQCKTRVFFMGNFAFMLVSKMVFGDFTIALETNWRHSDSAVGCNPYSIDWMIIYKRITKWSRKIFDDDVEKWDINFPVTEFTETFPEAYNNYYNLKGKKVEVDLGTRKISFRHDVLIYIVTVSNFSCAIVIGRKIFFSKFQASGVDLTCLFNTIANSACNRNIVEAILQQPFDEVAGQFCNGDDLVLASNQEELTRPKVWAVAKERFNHNRTNPEKGESKELSDVDSARFLQRLFQYQNGVLTCPLNFQSILGMVQYIHKPKDKDLKTQFAINCKVALMEASRYSREVFDTLKQELNTYLEQYGTSWVIHLTYEQALDDTITRIECDRGNM